MVLRGSSERESLQQPLDDVHSESAIRAPLLGMNSAATRNDSMQAKQERLAVMALVNSRKASQVALAFDYLLLVVGALSLAFSGFTAIRTWK